MNMAKKIGFNLKFKMKQKNNYFWNLKILIRNLKESNVIIFWFLIKMILSEWKLLTSYQSSGNKKRNQVINLKNRIYKNICCTGGYLHQLIWVQIIFKFWILNCKNFQINLFSLISWFVISIRIFRIFKNQVLSLLFLKISRLKLVLK